MPEMTKEFKDITLPNGLHVISEYQKWQRIYDIHIQRIINNKDKVPYDVNLMDEYMNAWGKVLNVYQKIELSDCHRIYKDFQYTRHGSFSKRTTTCICSQVCKSPSAPHQKLYIQLLLSPKQKALSRYTPDYPYPNTDDKVAVMSIVLTKKPVSMPPIIP